jgi:hypothetical protein
MTTGRKRPAIFSGPLAAVAWRGLPLTCPAPGWRVGSAYPQVGQPGWPALARPRGCTAVDLASTPVGADGAGGHLPRKTSLELVLFSSPSISPGLRRTLPRRCRAGAAQVPAYPGPGHPRSGVARVDDVNIPAAPASASCASAPRPSVRCSRCAPVSQVDRACPAGSAATRARPGRRRCSTVQFFTGIARRTVALWQNIPQTKSLFAKNINLWYTDSIPSQVN